MAAPISRWDEVLNLSLNVAQQTNKIKEFEILSSDAERVAFLRQKITFNEIDWIKNYFEQRHGLDKKCKEKAAADRQEGNKLFQKKQYKDAVHNYTQSVVNSPTNTEELALAYGNRSAAWFHQQEYMNCLEDINEAIKNGYPSATLHKLDIRQANCFYRLQDWAGASRALERFVHHLDEDKSLTDKRRGELLKEAKDIGIKVEKARVEVCQILREDRSIPTVSYGENSVLVQATCAINMMYNRSQGRYLVSHQDIKAGDTLIVERPFAAVLLPDHYKSHCHHCFLLLHSVYPCRQCTKVRYCSPRCQEESWSSYHQTECLYLGLLHYVGIAHLSLRIVLVAGLQFLIDFRFSLKDSRTVNSIAGLTEEGRYERNYLTVYELMTHTVDMSTEDLYQYSTTALLLLKILQCSGWFDGHTTTETEREHQDLQSGVKPECTCSSGERNRTRDTDTDSLISDQNSNQNIPIMSSLNMQCDCSGLTLQTDCSIEDHMSGDSKSLKEIKLSQNETCKIDRNEIEMYIGGLLLRHIQQLVCNAHAITEVHVTPTAAGEITPVEETSQVRVATAIYPTASLMNHSCDPTIISSFYKDTLIVRAVKDVQAGGEIFNCYGPHCKRMRRSERQQSLREQYFFTCNCLPCLDGAEQEEIFSSFCCPECAGPVCKVERKFQCRACQCNGENIQQVSVAAEKANHFFSQSILLLQQQNYKDALPMVKTCYKLRKKILYKYNMQLAETVDCLARCYAMSGQFKMASKYLQESLEIVKVIYGSESIEVANELRKLSEVLISAHKWKHALEVTKEAIKLFTMHYGKSHDSVTELCAAESELKDLTEHCVSNYSKINT